MARSRFNPWAAYTDLFGGLLIVTLGVLVVSQAREIGLERKVDDLQRALDRRTVEEQKAVDLFGRVEEKLKGRPERRIDKHCSTPVELCVDVDFVFATDSDQLSIEGLGLARIVAAELKQVLGEDTANVDILVEGHTDSSLPKNAGHPRTLYKYNWDLSARRASAVMYELAARDLAGFRLKAQGRANTDPRCLSQSGPDYLDRECGRKNRRTTLKIAYRFKPGGSAQ